MFAKKLAGIKGMNRSKTSPLLWKRVKEKLDELDTNKMKNGDLSKLPRVIQLRVEAAQRFRRSPTLPALQRVEESRLRSELVKSASQSLLARQDDGTSGEKTEWSDQDVNLDLDISKYIEYTAEDLAWMLFKELLQKQPNERLDDELKSVEYVMNQIKFFQSYTPEIRRELCRVMGYREFPADVAIFHQGDEGDAFYIILKGTVDVVINGIPEPVAELKSGQHFGELAIVNKEPRNATILTRDRCELLTLTKESYDHTLRELYVKDLRGRFNFFRKLKVFDGLTPILMQRVAEVCTFERFQAGRVVVRQGSEADCVYFLFQGYCRVAKTINFEEQSKNGDIINVRRTLQLSRLRPGDYFGEIGILNNVPRQATVITDSRCDMLVLSRTEFLRRLPSRTLNIFRGYIGFYFDEDTIREKYMEKRRWDAYKRQLVKDLVFETK